MTQLSKKIPNLICFLQIYRINKIEFQELGFQTKKSSLGNPISFVKNEFLKLVL